MAAAVKPYQIVVWGATGFTGRLVCEHIVHDYHGRIQWAMAGRDRRKLEGVRDSLCRINPAAKDVPILLADARDAVAVGNVVKQAQVVLSTAGPFSEYGEAMVSQAVAHGTHYCDITGEITWVKENIARHHKEAEAKGVKVVHCCGYDSSPSDLGTLMMVRHCAEKLGKKVAKVYTLVGETKGGFSGGTVASAFSIATKVPAAELSRLGSNQYYLAEVYNPKTGSDRPAPFLPTFLPEPQVWAGPFIMEGCNAKVVQASNALQPKGPYGTDFKYCEMLRTGSGWLGWGLASAVTSGMALLGLGLALPPARWLLKQMLPSPGQGPSLELQRTGYWRHDLVAVTEEEGGRPGQVVRGECGDKRDPGYWSTSRMLLEAGLALVLDAEAIQASGQCRAGGVLTPATAMGMVLVERLRAAGFTFRVLTP
ncbi:Saccharopine dehydrogenase-domain-containing protein [Haematococcus lacustris]